MKAITTRYVGPGNVRGSRIIASEPDGKRIVGELVGGYLGRSSYAWVLFTGRKGVQR